MSPEEQLQEEVLPEEVSGETSEDVASNDAASSDVASSDVASSDVAPQSAGAAEAKAVTPEPADEDDEVGPLPDLDLSADDIFERFGAEAKQDEEEVLPNLLAVGEEEVQEEESEEASSEQLPALDFDEGPEDVGVLPDPFADEEEEDTSNEPAWFIINCYSGYEHKVRHNLEQRIESMGMNEFIYQVVVPTVEEIELRDGKRQTVERCLYPGYLMVQMQLTDDSWYVVRNTPGVTGFVGMGNKPTPLRDEAVQRILRRMESMAPEVRATFKHGQKVRIIEGPFADFIGVVNDIDEERTKVRVLVSFFGRETPVELDFLQVEKT